MGRFHLSFPVHDLAAAKRFYVDGLGCELGREAPRALTLGLGGHQLVAQLTRDLPERPNSIYPRHFGLIFETEQEWQALVDRAKANGLTFYREPRRRFVGSRIEHASCFLEDPSHNLLEFKFYVYSSAILGEHEHTEVGDDIERDRGRG
jgi:extradiol dioxygenase family protein